mmetsp:Transcript_57075/g.93852  ORF Transcript_57075/g.93852 Transcript_57075/m.93852 type:complete len:201 (+) Transcript_57075:309-911(+)
MCGRRCMAKRLAYVSVRMEGGRTSTANRAWGVRGGSQRARLKLVISFACKNCSGLAMKMCHRSCLVTPQTSVLATACTLAQRGSTKSTDTSPNRAGGSRTARVALALCMRTFPRLKKNSMWPGVPSSTIMSPSENVSGTAAAMMESTTSRGQCANAGEACTILAFRGNSRFMFWRRVSCALSRTLFWRAVGSRAEMSWIL